MVCMGVEMLICQIMFNLRKNQSQNAVDIVGSGTGDAFPSMVRGCRVVVGCYVDRVFYA